jgi:hypothetical protein
LLIQAIILQFNNTIFEQKEIANKMKNVFLSLGLFFSVATIYAQKVGSTVQIETKDNNRIKGKVLEKTETHLTIETASTGNITIERNKIKDVEEINVIEGGKFAYENQHASRNFMTPTAFGVRKGEGYYKNTELILNSVNYGVTDYFSVGASADIIGPLMGQLPFLMTFNAKLSTNLNKNAAIAGGFTLTRAGDNENSLKSGIIYSVVTLGNKNHNITLGGGFPIVFQATNKLSNPLLFTVSGQYRFSNNFSLITENWFTRVNSASGGLGLTGIRYMRKGFAFDTAILYGGVGSAISSSTFSGVFPIPYVSVTIPFKTN